MHHIVVLWSKRCVHSVRFERYPRRVENVGLALAPREPQCGRLRRGVRVNNITILHVRILYLRCCYISFYRRSFCVRGGNNDIIITTMRPLRTQSYKHYNIVPALVAHLHDVCYVNIVRVKFWRRRRRRWWRRSATRDPTKHTHSYLLAGYNLVIFRASSRDI